jgi:predicted CoA-substrate-specific enzyme activase
VPLKRIRLFNTRENTTMARYFAGCDVGSTTGKAVILDAEGKIAADAIVPSEIDPEETAKQALGKACEQVAELNSIKDFAGLIGTGYGRNEVPFADENISEITCHAQGAYYCDSEVQTILDIGGQDMKGIALSNDGSVLDFAMNEKCAAGTGSFYQSMSRVFRMSLDELSALSLNATGSLAITAQCSVFAESEVISLLAQKHPPANIAAGIQNSIAKRCFALLKRVGARDRIVVTGGCAKNQGLINRIEKLLKCEISPLAIDPQLIGALGAAVISYNKNKK